MFPSRLLPQRRFLKGTFDTFPSIAVALHVVIVIASHLSSSPLHVPLFFSALLACYALLCSLSNENVLGAFKSVLVFLRFNALLFHVSHAITAARSCCSAWLRWR